MLYVRGSRLDWFRCLESFDLTADLCCKAFPGMTPAEKDRQPWPIFYEFIIHSFITTILIKQTQPVDLIWPSNRRKFNFYILASFVCNNLDNTVRRDYHNRCKKWKNAWGDKPECCTNCQSNWRTCYDECNEEIDLTPPGNLLFCQIHKL